MEQHINSYQGMNKDTAYDSLAATFYIDALDIRITTTTGESLGGYTNIKGNALAFQLDKVGTFNGNNWTALNPSVIGYATIRTRIILFVADDNGEQGWIYDLKYDPATKAITSSAVIYYSDRLFFKKDWPIEALGRFESDCVQRVYWTDYNNFFRSINVEDINLATTPVGLIDIFPDVKFTQPLLTSVSGGGQLNIGEYQIAYKLITSDGKETLISPPSNLIHIVSDSETGTNSNEYNGDNVVVNSSKAITITLDTSFYQDFYKIEFIAVYKSSATATTLVSSIEQAIIASQTSITFTYTGAESTLFDLELFEFLSRNYQFKTPKSITQKDGSLLIANIKDSVISLKDLLEPGETFESKTGRYDTFQTLPTNDPLQNAFNKAYNSDAHWNQVWQDHSQYRYLSDGLRLGGEGPNIAYTFHLEEFTLDANTALTTLANAGSTYVNDIPDTTPHDLNDGYGPYANSTFPNHASPFISGLLRGYKRGETYRFGIVFYTIKGEATFVEYIGDIKFPDISEIDSVNNSSGYKFWPITQKKSDDTGTYGYAMGIQFKIDFSTCPTLLNNITGYQIVRVKREDADKRRLSQGLLRGYYYNPINDSAPHNFDLRVNGDHNVVHMYPYYPPVPAQSQPARPNASFATLEDSNGISGYTKQFEDYLILGSYLSYYSPEISYDKNNVAASMLNLGANPCVLITGAYSDAIANTFQTFNLDDVNLQVTDEIKSQYYNTYPVRVGTVENIKKWQYSTKLKMEDTADYQLKVTPNYSGYFMRNYWCIDNYEDAGDPDVNPNRPQQGLLNNLPEFFKGGTSVLGKVQKIENDFFSNDPITSSAENYFRAPTALYALDRSTLTTVLNHEDFYPIAESILPKSEVYGGYTTDSLESNKFIPASPIIDPNNPDPRVFGGDIFINMFVVQSGLVEFNKDFYQGNNKYRRNNSRAEIVGLESTLNLDLANGATIRTRAKYEFETRNEYYLRQETNNSEAVFAKTLDMYSYNMVYSRENDDLGFYIQPANLQNCGANDIRAFLSNVKINEEVIDSWTKYGANNYYDVDDYGPINKVINWKDSVYFIQDKGIGAYAINRAAVTTTADGVPTQLGTGLGFGKHIYHSKVHGAIHQWAIQTTENGLYFFDAFHRKIFALQSASGQTANSPISEIKGMHSWLQALPEKVFTRKENGGDNPIIGAGVHVAKDIINDEVLFTFLSKSRYRNLATNALYTAGTIVYYDANNTYYYVLNTFTSAGSIIPALVNLLANSRKATAREVFNSDTLVYDELAQQFSARYSAAPPIWIQNGDIILSPDPLLNTNIYTNGLGDWGVFYDIQQECQLTLVVNPQADVNKILRTMEFNSIVRDDNKIIDRTKTITAFRIHNEYQDTNIVPYSTDRFRRKFEKWRLKIPRDQNSTAQHGRMRSTYFIVTLYFDNSDNKELIMNRLMSYFDYQVF